MDVIWFLMTLTKQCCPFCKLKFCNLSKPQSTARVKGLNRGSYSKSNSLTMPMITYNHRLLPLTVIIWKSCMWTADKGVNMKAIFTIMNTTWVVVKIRPQKNSGLYRIWTHDLCDTGYRGHGFKSQRSLIFTTAQVVFITVKIAFIFTLLLLSENFIKMIVKQIFVLFQEESFHGGEEVQLHLQP